MPDMNAGHLAAPVVAYKCVLQPVLSLFCAVLPRFAQKTLPQSKNIWDIFNQEFGFKFYTMYF
jgi:hypothetical protein